jgi:hypothetical protein
MDRPRRRDARALRRARAGARGRAPLRAQRREQCMRSRTRSGTDPPELARGGGPPPKAAVEGDSPAPDRPSLDQRSGRSGVGA